MFRFIAKQLLSRFVNHLDKRLISYLVAKLRNQLYNYQDIELIIMNQDCSVGIATGLTARGRFPARKRDFWLFDFVQTGSGAYPVSCAVGTGVLFPHG